MLDAFAGIRAARWRLDATRIQTRNDSWAAYLRGLKPVNQWKVFSVIAHVHWLVGEIKRVGVGSQLASVRLLVDREDLPSPSTASSFVKAALAASFQSAGMSLSTTGTAHDEDPQEGAVTVEMDSDSSASSGIQLADILLQAVQRRLPGFLPQDRLRG